MPESLALVSERTKVCEQGLASSRLLAQPPRKDLEEERPWAQPGPRPWAWPAFPLPNPSWEAALAADLITAWKFSFFHQSDYLFRNILVCEL